MQAHGNSMRIWGIVLIVFGLAVYVLRDAGVPPRAQLAPVAGVLHTMETSTSKGGGLGSLRFTLAGDARHFFYSAKAGAIDAVRQALEQAGASPVRVLVDPDGAFSPPTDSRTFHPVYEIQVGSTVVRAHEDAASAWAADDAVGALLGHGAAAAGALLLLIGLVRRGPRA